MSLIRKNFLLITVFLLISILYFALRVPNLTYQPVFADEAIYIRWAQIMKSEPTLRFLPVSDGKTPLFMWAMMPVFKVIPDPLLAGRTLAVFSGYATVLGVFLLSLVFLNKRTALFSAFLMTITPYIIFFDRIALVDTLLSAFVIWSIFTSFLLVKYRRIDLAMVLGFFLGGGLLTKTPAMFAVLVMPLTALTVNFSSKNRAKEILRLFGLFLISVATALGIYNILRLGPGFSNLSSRNQDYILGPMEVLNHPLDPFLPHVRDLIEWWPLLLGYPVIIALIIGIIYGVIRKNKYIISILLIALVPLLIQTVFLRTFTARYLLFSMPPLLIIASFGIDNILAKFKKYEKVLTILLTIIFLIWPAIFLQKLHTDIENVPLPRNERRGYLEDWTAGYGLREIAKTLEEESRDKLIVVGTEGSFGTLPDGLQIYFDKNRSVAFKPGNASLSDELRIEATKSATFYVANKSRFSIYSEGVEMIIEYPKAEPRDPKNIQDAIVLYKVLPFPDSINE